MASEKKDRNTNTAQRLADLEAIQIKHQRTEERLAEIHRYFLNLEPDPTQNINRLTELAGKLFGATCALYNRLDRGLLWSTAQWNAPPGYNPVDRPEGHICYDVIQRGRNDVFLVRNLTQTEYAHTDPNVSAYQLQTYVGQTVKIKKKPVGSLCIVFQEDFVPSREDEMLLGILASAIGVEEEYKLAEEKVKSYRKHLEAMVRQRTEELTKTNRQLQQETSEHKKTARALQHRAEELASLLEATQAGASTLDLEEVIRIIVRQMVKITGVAGCTLSKWEQQTGSIVTWIKWRQDKATGEESGMTYPLAHFPVTETALKERRPVVVSTNDPSADPAEVAYMEQSGTRSLLMVPLVVGERVIGLIELNDENEREFTATKIRLCQALADQAAVAIENARLYKQARQDAEIKSNLLHEINHRVKNNLSAIIGLLYAERRRGGIKNEPMFQTIMTDLINRVNGLAIVHRLLSKYEWKPLALSQMTEQLIKATRQWLPRGQSITVEVEPTPFCVESKQANNLALIINELSTNTIKYALLGQNTAEIKVHIASENEMLLFQYRDNGPGYPEELLQGKGYNVGMYLVQTLVRDGLQGELWLQNDQGAVTTIRFKPDTERSNYE